MEFNSTPPTQISFPKAETDILDYWEDEKVFANGSAFLESLERNKNLPRYTFYDGPPFASGDPHHGHILAGTIKDVVTRYAHQTGHNVPRNFGWDCHGVPVENEINKKWNIQRRKDILETEGRGIKWYNDECRSIVMRCVNNWKSTTRRLGRWIDFENDYKTMDSTFMESVWSVFRRLYDIGLVYRGERVMPISTALGTPLSKHEVTQETYATANDPSVIVSFKILDNKHGAEFVAWTTTPWTLPSNVALCVNPTMKYVMVKDLTKLDFRRNRVFCLAEARLSELFSGPTEYELLEGPFEGLTLKGLRYEPLFSFFKSEQYFRVVCDNYVTSDSGTGIVHLAPSFGEDDHRVCVLNKVVVEGDYMPCPVDDEGFFTGELLWVNAENQFAKSLIGKHVKAKDVDGKTNEANAMICDNIKAAGRLLKKDTIAHQVPFCARSKTPLIYKAVKSWFIRVESGEIETAAGEKKNVRDLMVENNKGIHWVPDFVGNARFDEWLKGARDWNVSRNRFWGTPIPIWQSEDCSEQVCVGSIEELRELSGQPDLQLTDIHREFVDNIEIKKNGKVLRRVPELFDCWFESGSMPYATVHYMFDPKEKHQAPPPNFPADFIAEGLDQTRGWFYTLMVLSTSLFQQVPFKNCVVNGLVLAADGTKMSKSKKNFPPPEGVITRHGADALRLYLIDSPVVKGEPLKFVEDHVEAKVREVFIPWFNALRFFLQNVRRFNSSKVSWDSTLAPKRSSESKNIMDIWILAEMRDLTRYVRKEMELCHLYNVTPRLLLFIDDLTNWYVRLNRARLKGASGGEEDEEEEEVDSPVASEEDTLASLSTLFEVLLSLTRLMAPISPFFAEYSYQQLCPKGSPRRAEPSVHFLTIPESVPQSEEDEKILRKLKALQKCVQLGRTARGLKIKIPVLRVILVADDAQLRADLKEVESYLKEELNALEIEVPEDPSTWGNVLVRLDEKGFGQKYKKDKEAVKKLVLSHPNPRDIYLALEAGEKFSILPDKPPLERGDVIVSRQLNVAEQEKYGAESSLEVMVVVDRTLNRLNEDSGIAREFKSFVQKLRKKSGLSPEDKKVNVFCSVKGPESERVKACLESTSFGFSVEVNQPPPQAIILGSTLDAKLMDNSKFPNNSADIFLSHQYVKTLNTEIPEAVNSALHSLVLLEPAKESWTINFAGKAYLVKKGTDFAFSV